MIAVREEWPALDSDAESVRNMASGVIRRALRDVVRYRGDRRPKFKKIYEEVYSWMYEEDPGDYEDPLDRLMSFEGICDILGWDPNWLRRRVKTMTPADLDKLSMDR